MMICEICGAYVQQMMVHLCAKGRDELCGPFFEKRRHVVNGVEHVWFQLHNCIDPQPDACWVGCGSMTPQGTWPACCRDSLDTFLKQPPN